MFLYHFEHKNFFKYVFFTCTNDASSKFFKTIYILNRFTCRQHFMGFQNFVIKMKILVFINKNKSKRAMNLMHFPLSRNYVSCRIFVDRSSWDFAQINESHTHSHTACIRSHTLKKNADKLFSFSNNLLFDLWSESKWHATHSGRQLLHDYLIQEKSERER